MSLGKCSTRIWVQGKGQEVSKAEKSVWDSGGGGELGQLITVAKETEPGSRENYLWEQKVNFSFQIK